MHETKRMRIGRYESWMDGSGLHLQLHQFGRSNGFSTSMDPKETLQLLELLEQNREAIFAAVEHDQPVHVTSKATGKSARWSWS